MPPALNRSAIVVTPKQPFVAWLHAADPTSVEIGPEEICEATVYLLPDASAVCHVIRSASPADGPRSGFPSMYSINR